MTRHPLRTFFVLAFGIAWGVPGLVLLIGGVMGGVRPSMSEFSPLSYVSLWAPAVAALIVIWQAHDWTGVSRYVRRLGRPTGAWRWYVVVALGIPLVNLGAALGMEGLGWDGMSESWTAFGTFAVVSLLRFTEGPMEEIGWRGFALPILQRRFTGLGASFILGSLWALWHAPAFVIGRSVGGGVSGSLPYVLSIFFLTLIAQTVLLTVLYNATQGSVMIAMLFHWMTNLPYPWETGLDLSPIAGPLWIAAAVAVGLTVGRRYLGRERLHVEVAPGLFPAGGGAGAVSRTSSSALDS